MAKQDVLVVAERAADSPELIAGLRRRGADHSARVTLLVSAGQRWRDRHRDSAAWSEAARAAEIGIDALREAGIDVEEAIVADPDPVLAVGDALHARRFDEILVVAPPPGLVALLRPSLAERLRRETDLPVAELTVHGDRRRQPQPLGEPVGAH